MARSRRAVAGFTLVEMTVATVLLFVGVVSATLCMSAAVRSQEAAEARANAALLAERRLVELAANPAEVTPGEQQGEFGEDYAGLGYRQTVEPTEYPQLYYVAVEVASTTGSGRRPITVATYLSVASELGSEGGPP